MTAFEFKLLSILIALMGFMLGLSLVYTTSVKYGFYVHENILGESMESTLNEDSKILYISPKVRKIRRGDIVDANVYINGTKVILGDTGKPLIMVKRVIALPGETIRINGNLVYINGVLLSEPYAYYDSKSNDDMTVTLDHDQYFLMGDNRMHSDDSRVFDLQRRESILGVALIVR